MNKHFKFYEESWYASGGCDCCEPTFMECYNSDDTDCSMGSANSEEACYVQSIITTLGRENLSMEESELANSFYCLSLDQLMRIADNIGIIVEIVEEDEQ